jgi:hypothetical protein
MGLFLEEMLGFPAPAPKRWLVGIVFFFGELIPQLEHEKAKQFITFPLGTLSVIRDTPFTVYLEKHTYSSYG